MSTTVSNALAGGNVQTGKPGLTAGTTTTYTTGATAVFAILGVMYSKTAVTNGATPTTDGNTAAAYLPLTAGKSCAFIFAFNASGTVSVMQGRIVNGGEPIPWPAIDSDRAAIGYLKAVAGSTLSGSWTFGSSNLSSVTGMTYTFADLFAIPARPAAP